MNTLVNTLNPLQQFFGLHTRAEKLGISHEEFIILTDNSERNTIMETLRLISEYLDIIENDNKKL